MKNIFTILLSLLISTSAFCQSAVDSFFNIKTQKPPENWVELIQGKEWIPYKTVVLHDDSILIFNSILFKAYRFDASKLFSDDLLLESDSSNVFWTDSSLFWIEFDTVGRAINYQARQKIYSYFLVNPDYSIEINLRVINVNEQYLSVEHIDLKGFIDYRDAKKAGIKVDKQDRTIIVFKKLQP